MGNTQTQNSPSQEYEIVHIFHQNRKLLKRKHDSQLCLLLTLPIYGQQKHQLIERLKLRTGPEKPLLMTPLLDWHRKDQPSLCGNEEKIELLFGEVSPTLQEVYRYRRDNGLEFNASQILYILKNIALALKNFQKIKEEHGKVNLSHICLRRDVLLLDSLAFQRRLGLQTKKDEIEGFPSPQKLRSMYDSLSNYEQLRGDLFSLGLVCLQLYHIHFDVKGLYTILDPRFSNYQFNFENLTHLLSQVMQPQLREALTILTSLNSKDRLNIYAFLRNIVLDMQQVRLFAEPKLSKNTESSTPIQSMVKQSTVQRPVQREISTVNPHIQMRERPREIAEPLVSQQKTNVQFSHSVGPSISFRVGSQQTQHQPLASIGRANSVLYPASVYPASSFQPLRFTLLENVGESSQYGHAGMSKGSSEVSAGVPRFSTFLQQDSVRAPPSTQVLHQVALADPQVADKVQIQRFTPVKAAVKIINVSSMKKQNFQAKQQSVQVLKAPSAQTVKVQSVEAPKAGSEQKVDVVQSGSKTSNQAVRTQSIYQQQVRPLGQGGESAKGMIRGNEVSFSKGKEQQADTVPVSNSYVELQKVQSQELKVAGSRSPRKGTEGQSQTGQLNRQPDAVQQRNIAQRANQSSGPNPEDKIEFVIEQYGIGTRYEGGKLNGMRHGKGKFYYKEGSYYDGEWRNNKMHGVGVLYYPNGTIAYEGEWREDEFEGRGIVYNDQQVPLEGSFDFTDFNKLDEEWVRYEGELRSDAKEGRGRLILTNGEVYEGEFLKDTVHGSGVFRSGKSERRGVWEYGKLKRLL